jgi:hemolysin activation/secretion protein
MMLSGQDPEKVGRANRAMSKAYKPAQEKIVNFDINWTIVPYPGTAWAKQVFQGLGDDEATAKLADAIFAATRIDRPDPGTKRLRIDVTPGAPVTGREIRFVGNTALDQKRLDSEIVEAGVETEGWLDRTVVERALRQAYIEEGFLKAEVIGQPLIIEGTTGVLVIAIKEGPQAQITDVKWAGVGEARLPEIEKAAAIETPAAYVTADVNDARRRIEDLYRKQGFNSAEVEAQPTVNADDTVVLTYTVVEGTQQVLQDVQLGGGNRVLRRRRLACYASCIEKSAHCSNRSANWIQNKALCLSFVKHQWLAAPARGHA